MAIEDKIDILAGKLIELGGKLAEPATQAAIAAVKINALQGVIAGAACLAAAVCGAFSVHAVWTWGYFTGLQSDPVQGVVLILAAMPTIMFSIAAAIFLLDVWTWAPLFYPEAYLAKIILKL